MKKKSFIGLAVAVGLVGLAACGGSETSETSTVRTKNAALVTNVQKYVGVLTSQEHEGYQTADELSNAAFRTGDKFTVSFDLNLDVVDANPLAPSATAMEYMYNCRTGRPVDKDGCLHLYTEYSAETDFRSAFSNLTLTSNPGNRGNEDMSKIKWAKCPYQVRFDAGWQRPNSPVTSEMQMFKVIFVEAPNDSFVTSDCNEVPESERYRTVGSLPKRNLFQADGKAVPVTGASLTFEFWKKEMKSLVTLPDNAQPALKDLFPTGLDGLVADETVAVHAHLLESKVSTNQYTDENGVVQKHEYNRYRETSIRSLSSTRVKDYSPFGLTASADATGIALNWNRSADLAPEDQVTHVLERSTDGFKKDVVVVQFTDSQSRYSLEQPSCITNPDNKLAVGTVYSYRVSALDKDGIQSAPTDVATVTKTATNISCPPETLAAPTDVAATYSVKDYEYSVSWNAPADADDSVISYCVESSVDSFQSEDEISQDCGFETTDAKIPFDGGNPRSFRVVAARDSGAVSDPSAPINVKLPDANPVTNIKTSLVEDGVKISWTPGVQPDGYTRQTTNVIWGFMEADERGPQVGSGGVQGSNAFIIPPVDLTEAFAPGVKIWIDVVGCNEVMCDSGTSTIFENPLPQVLAADAEEVTTTTAAGEVTASTTATTDTTAAPSVEAAATAALLDTTSTEIQLPNGDFDLSFSFDVVSKGLGVRKQDIRLVEYQTDGGNWTAVADGKAVTISKDAAKLGLRVTKTNGEVVESTKAIVHTMESADTTMAPEDSSEAESTVDTTSSDSSSGNNIILYVVIALVLAGGAAMFFKKKK